MRYLVKATVNYPETEADTPDHECLTISGVMAWINVLLEIPETTSFVITVCKKID